MEEKFTMTINILSIQRYNYFFAILKKLNALILRVFLSFVLVIKGLTRMYIYFLIF